jgi:hypothetical protein
MIRRVGDATMGETTHQTFACPACRRQIIWSSRIAGTRVHCSCGKAFVAPIETPVATVEPDTYDLEDESLLEELPARRSRAASQTVPLQYESSESRSGMTMSELLSHLGDRSVLVPGIIVFAGIALRFCVPLFFSTSGSAKAGTGALLILLGLAMSVVTMLAGVGLVAKFTGADLGALPATIAKLLAISVMDSVLFALVASVDNGDGMRGMIIAWHAVLLFNWVMFATLFEFDTQESLFATAVVGILQAIAACALWKM